MNIRFKKPLFIVVADIAIAIALVVFGWSLFVNWVDNMAMSYPWKPAPLLKLHLNDWLENSSSIYFEFWESSSWYGASMSIKIEGMKTGAIVTINELISMDSCWTVEINKSEWHGFLRSLYNSGIHCWETYYNSGIEKLKECCAERYRKDGRRVINPTQESIQCCDSVKNIDISNWCIGIQIHTVRRASSSDMRAWGTLKNVVGNLVRKIRYRVIYGNLTAPIVYSCGDYKHVPYWEEFHDIIEDFRITIEQKRVFSTPCEP